MPKTLSRRVVAIHSFLRPLPGADDDLKKKRVHLIPVRTSWTANLGARSASAAVRGRVLAFFGGIHLDWGKMRPRRTQSFRTSNRPDHQTPISWSWYHDIDISEKILLLKFHDLYDLQTSSEYQYKSCDLSDSTVRVSPQGTWGAEMTESHQSTGCLGGLNDWVPPVPRVPGGWKDWVPSVPRVPGGWKDWVPLVHKVPRELKGLVLVELVLLRPLMI